MNQKIRTKTLFQGKQGQKLLGSANSYRTPIFYCLVVRFHSALKKRLKIFDNSFEILLSKLLKGKLPQNVIEPVEKTAPPAEFSKYSMSALINSSFFTPGKLVR